MFLSDCDEGCSECHDAWMSDDTDNVYQVCTDEGVEYKFANPCNSRQNKDKCNTDSEEPCLISWDHSDTRKNRSPTKACRTVPESYRNDVVGNGEFKWSKRT